jgi:hypothetical protein
VVAVVTMPVVAMPVVAMPAVAKVKAPARPVTAPTLNLASHTVAIPAQAPLPAGPSHSITPSLASTMQASPPHPRPRQNLANPKLTARASQVAARNSRCGPRPPAVAAAPGAAPAALVERNN